MSDVLCWQDVSPQKKLILSRRLVTPRRWRSSRSRGSSSSMIHSSTSGSTQISKRASRKVLPVLIPQDTNYLHPHKRSPGADSDLGSSISKTVSDSRPRTPSSGPRVSSRLQTHHPCVSSPAIFVIDQAESPDPHPLVTSGHDSRPRNDNLPNTASILCPSCSQNIQHSSSFLTSQEKSRNKIQPSQTKYLVRSSSKSRQSLSPSGLFLYCLMLYC